MTSYTLSPSGMTLIKTFEGLRLKAYLCPAGVPTIGYGHTGSVKLGDTITAAHAEHLLREDLRRFEAAIDRLVAVPLTQGQFDALVSFTFNVGTAAFQRSTLRRVLNTGEYDAVPSQFKRWVYGDPKKPPLLGLLRRRHAEIARWLS